MRFSIDDEVEVDSRAGRSVRRLSSEGAIGACCDDAGWLGTWPPWSLDATVCALYVVSRVRGDGVDSDFCGGCGGAAVGGLKLSWSRSELRPEKDWRCGDKIGWI